MARKATKNKDKVDKVEEKDGKVDKTDEKNLKVDTVLSNNSESTMCMSCSSSSSSSSAGGDVQTPAAKDITDVSERDQQDYIYIFPPQGRVCPRCRAADTSAYATKDNIQYRKCNRPICRHRYSVRGTRVKK